MNKIREERTKIKTDKRKLTFKHLFIIYSGLVHDRQASRGNRLGVALNYTTHTTLRGLQKQVGTICVFPVLSTNRKIHFYEKQRSGPLIPWRSFDRATSIDSICRTCNWSQIFMLYSSFVRQKPYTLHAKCVPDGWYPKTTYTAGVWENNRRINWTCGIYCAFLCPNIKIKQKSTQTIYMYDLMRLHEYLNICELF